MYKAAFKTKRSYIVGCNSNERATCLRTEGAFFTPHVRDQMLLALVQIVACAHEVRHCRKWAKPMNSLLHSKGLYYAINKTAGFVCVNQTQKDCRAKRIGRFVSYPLDLLMSKGPKAFCTDLFSGDPKSVTKGRVPKCSWCMSAMSVFENALEQRGQEAATNLTRAFCDETEFFAPHLFPKCDNVIQEFLRSRKASLKACQLAELC
jgi:hypothetical protein